MQIIRGTGSYRVLTGSMLLMMLGGCGRNENREEAIVKRVIESVRLPSGARDPKQYSHYFAYGSSGLIDVVFVLHSEHHRNSVMRACQEANSNDYPCNQSDYGVVAPGKSRWLSDSSDLPAQSGGGCSYIRIEYDPTTEHYRSVNCNGPY